MQTMRTDARGQGEEHPLEEDQLEQFHAQEGIDDNHDHFLNNNDDEIEDIFNQNQRKNEFLQKIQRRVCFQMRSPTSQAAAIA